MAESLDRTHKALVSDVAFTVKGKHKATLIVKTNDDCPLEKIAIHAQLKAFARTFKRTLQVEFKPV